jgi:hypothetical protein
MLLQRETLYKRNLYKSIYENMQEGSPASRT